MAAFIPQIGSRVSVMQQGGGANVHGTIQYVGETEFKDGEWVGVELDLPKGKHNGSVSGVQYFKCAPNKGIFVRPNACKPIGAKKDGEREEENYRNIMKGSSPDVNSIPRAMQNISITDPTPPSEVPLFMINTRAFIYDKKNSSWVELGSGTTEFTWSAERKKFIIQMKGNSNILDHYVDPNAKLEDTVATQQSWVFRALKRQTQTKDVLCLQFSSVHEARVFVSTFEGCRESMLKLSQSRNNNTQSYPHSLHHQTIAANTSTVVVDNSLNKVPSKTRVMRRRLTVSGSNPNLDGFESGASNDQNSPQPGSPRKIHRTFFTDNTTVGGGGEVVAFTGVSRKGLAPYNPDKQNQDSMIMQQLPNNGNCKGELLLAVFDGHGENGHLVSRHFAARIPQLLAANPNFGLDHETGNVIAESLKIAEREIVNDPKVDTALSGTTAVVSVLRGDVLYVANVGDSRIIKGASTGDQKQLTKAVDISVDHKPDSPEEQARIEAKGGRVFAMKYDDGIDGPARVWLSYSNVPGLAMSRSLGDTVGKEAGVVSDAELHVIRLSPADRYIVLATDGLWEFMESQEVCDIVQNCMKTPDPATIPDPRIAISELIKESNTRWRREEPVIDDTTIIVAYFK